MCAECGTTSRGDSSEGRCCRTVDEMARRPRAYLPDGTYHVTASAVAGDKIFRDDDDRRTFLRLLERAARGFSWRIDTFCLMSTHYHLLLATTRPELSDGFRYLNGHYARSFNDRYGRRGHVFAGRFSAWVVESQEHATAARQYILLNPVKAGLCVSPRDWRWSGSRYGRDLG